MTVDRPQRVAVLLLAAPVVVGASLALPWWGSPLERVLVNGLAYAAVAWRPKLWVLLPAFVLTQYSVGRGVVSWSDWSEYVGAFIVASTALALLVTILLEPGSSGVPWYRRPVQRPGALLLLVVVILALIGMGASETLRSQGVRPYAVPFVVLCAAQTLWPVKNMNGARRQDAFGTRRHWTVTLVACGLLTAYLCAWAWPDLQSWWYYTRTFLLPNGLVVFAAARALPIRARRLPLSVRQAA